MAKGHDLVTFGETMIRLSPSHFRRLEQTTSLDMNVGGSELNTAVTAQRLGLDVAYVTRLCRNPLGRVIENKAREQGVDTSHVVWTDEDRVGVYFVEFGASPRANSVIYDRCDSAMARICAGDVDWDAVFSKARVFHTSGITPALSESACEATQEAIQKAKEQGLKVSIDLNYRARLWSPAEARSVMETLVSQADILFTTEEDTRRVFGIETENYEKTAQALAERFRLEVVAITLRETPAVWHNNWSAIALSNGQVHRSPTYAVEIVDRVGSGDCFAGGFLFGYLHGGVPTGVGYGTAVSALKQTNPGDLCWVTPEEVERVMKGAGLRIVR